jgi:DNA segregation ATPase FtsK/SpoIIIE-like protein
MHYLVGPVASFVFPALCLYIGVKRIVFMAVNTRFIRFLLILWFEVCVLLAIPNMPITPENTFQNNFIGHITVVLLQLVFGHHAFGPYFITLLGIVITLLMFFRVDVVDIVLSLRGMFMHIWRAIRGFTGSIRFKRVHTPAEVPSAHSCAGDQDSTLSGEGVSGEGSEEHDDVVQDTAPGRESLYGDEDTDDAVDTADTSEEDDARIQTTALQGAGQDRDRDTREPDEDAPGESGQSENTAGPQTSQDVPITPPADDSSPAVVEGEDDETAPHMSGQDYYKVAADSEEKNKAGRPVRRYKVPGPDVLDDPPAVSTEVDESALREKSQLLEKTLRNFGIEAHVTNVNPGPVITRYDMKLAPGIKVSKVLGLQDDIALAMGGKRIRIQAPIPGKAAIGIEVPNEDRQIVYFKHILCSDAFKKAKATLPFIIGRTISGAPFVSDINKMPHLLIAGQTGSGKSVGINCLICSLLMYKTPEQLRLILIDPKKVELSYYQGIPHLMSPVVTEPKEAVKALHWAQIEMDRRYRVLQSVGAKNIASFNERIESGRIKEDALDPKDRHRLAYIVIIVDELNDLMMTASKDVETHIQRIAQLARAVGIHLVVATQRPSVDVITGPIKANLTSRIAFRTIQSNDSRTILNRVGSEKLLGMGDMLYLRSGAPDIERFHGAFISEEDIERIVEAIRAQQVEVEKIDSFEKLVDEKKKDGEDTVFGNADDEDGRDAYFDDAARIVVSTGQGSTSFIQRRLKVGYARAGRIMDELEHAGIVGPSEGSKSREVLIGPDELERVLSGDEGA